MADFSLKNTNETDKQDTSGELDKLDTHFIFNALNSIKYVILSDDTEGACDLINDTGAYIRYSIQTIRACKCVTFREEMKYVKSYINIQKLRYPMINVSCEINDDDFTLPSMSVIFLSENAIRHGFDSDSKSWDIHISTWRTESYHVFQMCDNGIGFNLDLIKQSNEFGTLGYIKYNIENLCNGKMIINSIRGQGTSVEIKIPIIN